MKKKRQTDDDEFIIMDLDEESDEKSIGISDTEDAGKNHRKSNGGLKSSNEKTKGNNTKGKNTAVLLICIPVAIIAIVAVVWLIQKAVKNKNYTENMNLAGGSFEGLAYDAAINSYEGAIEIIPERFDAYEGMINVYIQKAEENLKSASENMILGDDEGVIGNPYLACEYYDAAILKIEGSVSECDMALTVVTNAINSVNEKEIDRANKTKDMLQSVKETVLEKKTILEEKRNAKNLVASLADSDLSEAVAGNVVCLGTYDYPYDSEGPQPLEWEVLEINNGKALLFSRYILTNHIYDQEGTAWNAVSDTNWQQSQIREWLNSSVINDIFDENQMALVAENTCSNPDSESFYSEYYPEWWLAENTNPCAETVDKLFLLNFEEYKKYFGPLKSSQLGATSNLSWKGTDGAGYYRNDAGYDTENDAEGKYWLRSAGGDGTFTMIIDEDGRIGCYESVTSENCGVRVAVWVSLK